MKTPTFALVLAAALAGAVLFRTPYRASDLDVVPDSVEYAVGACRLAAAGQYDIPVGGERHPPRYPPWFSLLVLAPACFLLGPEEPGHAVFPVLLFGLAGAVFAFRLAARVSGSRGGFVAVALLLLLPLYRFYGCRIMTDVPVAALVLAAALLYAHIRTDARCSRAAWLAAGLAIALAAGLRPVCCSMVLPFLCRKQPGDDRRAYAARLARLLAPGAILAAATLVYNTRTFGSPLRTGYHYWCAFPYEFPGLVLSWTHFGPNLRVLARSSLPALVLLACLAALLRRRGPARADSAPGGARNLRALVEFAVLGTGPIVLFHLAYFYPDARFYLPATVLAAVSAAACTGRLLPDRVRPALTPAAALALAGVVAGRCLLPAPPPPRRAAADRILRHTPRGSWVLSSLDPVYLEFLTARCRERRIVPLTRGVEYASKVVSRTPLGIPRPPGDWRDFPRQALLRAGAREAVPWVAAEGLTAIEKWIRGGGRAFVETGAADADTIQRLAARFRFIRRDEDLYELEPDGRQRPAGAR